MPAALLDLFQLADSSFPSGSYAHSLGLEWLCRQPNFDLEATLRVRLAEHLARTELPVVRAAYHAVCPAELLTFDRLMDVFTPSAELRAASRSVGRSFLRAAAGLRPDGACRETAEQDVEHLPVVFGAVLREWDIPLEDGLSVYALQAVRQQLSAAQRLRLVGQSAVQHLLDHLKPAIVEAVRRSRQVSLDEAGAFAPWFDLAGIRHQQLSGRLFLS